MQSLSLPVKFNLHFHLCLLRYSPWNITNWFYKFPYFPHLYTTKNVVKDCSHKSLAGSVGRVCGPPYWVLSSSPMLGGMDYTLKIYTHNFLLSNLIFCHKSMYHYPHFADKRLHRIKPTAVQWQSQTLRADSESKQHAFSTLNHILSTILLHTTSFIQVSTYLYSYVFIIHNSTFNKHQFTTCPMLDNWVQNFQEKLGPLSLKSPQILYFISSQCVANRSMEVLRHFQDMWGQQYLHSNIKAAFVMKKADGIKTAHNCSCFLWIKAVDQEVAALLCP